MKLVSPEGHAQPLSIGASPRPRSLKGLRIGLLDNAKAPVDKMMVHIEARLKEKYPGIETYTASKLAASRPVDERMLKGLRDNCDVVINALGDWGSCTSWSVHDSIEVEKLGLPSVLLVSTSFTALAYHQAKTLGMPAMPTVVLPHPLGGTPLDSVLAKVDKAFDEILAKLTTPLAAPGEQVVHKSGERVEISCSDEWTDLQHGMMKRGWGDGLPLVPPTEERVAAMVAGAAMPAGQVVAVVAPRMGVATVELIAASAVMAGCRPQHMPLLIAAVQAMADPQFNLYGCQATTHCVAPLLIVNGPLAQVLNIHSGAGCFGPGPWDNGVVGRAIRLILLNIGGAVPGEIDKATMGHPGKFSFCIAENEAGSPWPTLAAQRGYAKEISTVTMVGGEAPHNINEHEAVTAGGLLTTICGAMAQSGQNTVYYNGEPLLILSPEHAATIAHDGLTKEDVQRAIYDDARIPITHFGREIIERRLYRRLGHRYKNRHIAPDTLVTIAQRWEDVMVIVAGGAGKHSMWVPTFGATRSVTRAILKADGSPWLPEHFKN